jgi:predicted RNA-binding Zn-ribbon protein involved in translation (DUF1610 family)
MFKMNNFLSFWYYDHASDYNCKKCQEKSKAYLLRYRVFLGFNKPLIQIKTAYMLVCPKCGDYHRLDGEGKIAPYINQIKNGRARKVLIKEEDKTLIAYIQDHLLSLK